MAVAHRGAPILPGSTDSQKMDKNPTWFIWADGGGQACVTNLLEGIVEVSVHRGKAEDESPARRFSNIDWRLGR